MIKNKILNALLDIYESSKTYTGENKVNQVFSIKPSKIFKDYESDNANVDDIERFESQLGKLADWESEFYHLIDQRDEIMERIRINSMDKRIAKLKESHLIL